jgi:arginine repressor
MTWTSPMTKAARQAQVAAILARQDTPVHSQEELARLLGRRGVRVTQATLSRDLDELGAVRLRGRDGALAYALPGQPGGPGSMPGGLLGGEPAGQGANAHGGAGPASAGSADPGSWADGGQGDPGSGSAGAGSAGWGSAEATRAAAAAPGGECQPGSVAVPDGAAAPEGAGSASEAGSSGGAVSAGGTGRARRGTRAPGQTAVQGNAEPMPEAAAGQLAGSPESSGRLARVTAELLLGAEASANLVVLRTPAGAAQFLASVIDHASWPSILGTVAGDDTVLVISRDPAGGQQLADALLRLAERRSQAGRA